MSKPLVSDELWNAIAPLLPPESPKPKGGRPGVPDRAALAGIIFVLKSGIPWEMLPHNSSAIASLSTACCPDRSVCFGCRRRDPSALLRDGRGVQQQVV